MQVSTKLIHLEFRIEIIYECKIGCCRKKEICEMYSYVPQATSESGDKDFIPSTTNTKTKTASLTDTNRAEQLMNVII